MKTVVVLLLLQSLGVFLSVLFTLENPLSTQSCMTGIFGMFASLAMATGFLLWALRAAYSGWTQNWPDRLWLGLTGAAAISGGFGLIHFVAFVRCSV